MADPQSQSPPLDTSGIPTIGSSALDSTKLTIPEFAKKLRERVPEWKDVPDDKLARKVFERQPELMNYVQTMEPRGRKNKSESQPGYFTKLGQSLGVPTSKEELAAISQHQREHPIETVAKAINPLAVSVPEAIFNYGKGIWEAGQSSMAEARKGMHKDDKPGLAMLGKIAKADYDFMLKGPLGPFGGAAAAGAQEDLKRKNYWGAFGGATGAAILSLLTFGGLGAEESAATTGAEAVKNTERLASTSPGTGEVGVSSYDIADVAKHDLREAAVRRGYKDASGLVPSEQEIGKGPQGVFPTRARGLTTLGKAKTEATMNPITNRPMMISNLRAGAQRALQLADDAVDIAQEPFNKIIDEYGNEPLGDVKSQVVSSLRKRATEYRFADKNSSIARALDSQADTIEGNPEEGVKGVENVRGLHEVKIHANKMVGDMLQLKTPGQVIQAADAQTVYAWKITADTIREFLYPELQRLSGTNLTEAGAREFADIRFRDGLYRTYYTSVDPEQATAAALGWIGGLEEGSFYSRQLWKRASAIIRQPAGRFNLRFQQGLGKLGEGMQPETVTTTRPVQGLLKGETHRFQLPAGIPREVFEGKGAVEAAKSYAGQETVPNPDYTPMGESRIEQEVRGGGAEPSARDRVAVLRSTVENLKRKVDAGGEGHFQALDQLRIAEGKLAQAEREMQHFDWSKTQSVGGGESDNFTRAREELFPGKRELTTEEIGKVSVRAKELGKLDFKGLAERSSQRATELGSQRATVPKRSITGEMTPPEERAAQIGPQGAAVPERSLTGEPTKTQSRWQYTTAAKHPGEAESARIEGPGVFQTTDPKAAATALKGMQDFTKTPEFSRLDFATRERIRGAVRDLDHQLKVYAVNAMKKPPRRVTVTPMREGKIPRTGTRAVATTAVSSAAQHRYRKEGEEAP